MEFLSSLFLTDLSDDDYKGIGVSSYYDESNCKLLLGDHLGFINIYKY